MGSEHLEEALPQSRFVDAFVQREHEIRFDHGRMKHNGRRPPIWEVHIGRSDSKRKLKKPASAKPSWQLLKASTRSRGGLLGPKLGATGVDERAGRR
jgi:hypothetical protein